MNGWKEKMRERVVVTLPSNTLMFGLLCGVKKNVFVILFTLASLISKSESPLCVFSYSTQAIFKPLFISSSAWRLLKVCLFAHTGSHLHLLAFSQNIPTKGVATFTSGNIKH